MTVMFRPVKNLDGFTASSKGLLSVRLAPAWYLEHQDIQIKPGDRIEVKGANPPKSTALMPINTMAQASEQLEAQIKYAKPNMLATKIGKANVISLNSTP